MKNLDNIKMHSMTVWGGVTCCNV